MKKTLLVIGAGIEACAGIQQAKSMGLKVIGTDANPEAPGLLLADEALIASTYDIPSSVAAVKAYVGSGNTIDGVLCVASDIPLTVASVASALDLPGIDLNSARLASDKLAMKEQFLKDGINIPWFSAVHSIQDLRRVFTLRNHPLIIKPVDSRGARGVLRLSDETDLDWAFAEAQKHSPSHRVMVEEFLSGPQVSTESIMIDGVAHTPGFADRNYEFLDRYAPYIIENGGQLPSRLDDKTQQMVRDLVQQAALSMGVRNGVVKGDIVVHDGTPYVIELAARLSGGYFCTHEIPLNTGVDLVGAAIRQALGEVIDPLDLTPKHKRPVAQRYFFPKPGKVMSITGLDRYTNHPGVEMLELRVQPGDTIGPIDSHPARAGVVITTADSVADAVALAEEIVDNVVISVE